MVWYKVSAVFFVSVSKVVLPTESKRIGLKVRFVSVSRKS